VNSRNRILLEIGVALIGIIVGLGIYASHQAQIAKTAETLATEAGKREQVWKDQAADSDRSAAMNEDKVRQRESEIRVLQAKFDSLPKPAPPVPAPAADADLASGLMKAGISPGFAVKEAPGQLGRLDASLVWKWHEDALRLAPTEDRLDASMALNAGQSAALDAQKSLVIDLQTSRDAWKRATGASDERAEQFRKESKALTKALTAEKWQKWLLVGGSAAASFYAGRKLR
jgi:hypothetical protein